MQSRFAIHQQLNRYNTIMTYEFEAHHGSCSDIPLMAGKTTLKPKVSRNLKAYGKQLFASIRCCSCLENRKAYPAKDEEIHKPISQDFQRFALDSQSSISTDLMTQCLVNARAKKQIVATPVQMLKETQTAFRSQSGLSKFGVTPSGGGTEPTKAMIPTKGDSKVR